MDTAQFAGYVLDIAEHDEIAITNHPHDTASYDVAVALNLSLALLPQQKPVKVFGTTGDTIIVVRVASIPDYLDAIMAGVDPRHIPEIQAICERQKCSD